MKESDWKQFKVIKKKAIERFCSRALAEFGEVISNEDEHVHDRYGRLYQLVRERDKEMSRVFDDHSRSKAPFQLSLMRMRGLVDEDWLAGLSDELRDGTDPERHT